MSEAPPPPVMLEYGAERKRPFGPALLRNFAAMIIGALAGLAGVALLYRPMYTSVGYAQVSPGNLISSAGSVQQMAFEAGVMKQLNGASLAAAVTLPPPTPAGRAVTRTEFARNVKVQPIAQSRLIQISYSDRDPAVALQCASAAMAQATQIVYQGAGVTLVVPPAAPPAASGKMIRAGVLVGGFVGLVIGIILNNVWFGSRRQRATP